LPPKARSGEAEGVGGRGDIVNCESVPGKTGSLSVSSYSSHSMMAIHYVPLSPYSAPRPSGMDARKPDLMSVAERAQGRDAG
jgi:hypothetical protein